MLLVVAAVMAIALPPLPPGCPPDCVRLHLTGAALFEADLTGADLSETVLRFANLARANLGSAVLALADLRDATLACAICGVPICVAPS